MRYLLLFFNCLLLLSLTHTSFAQSEVYDSDSIVKVTSFLADDILTNESIADTLLISVKGKGSLVIKQLETDDFLKKYEKSSPVLSKMRMDGEPYCNLVPNCNKILQLPFIKAIQPLGQNKYALIGYLRAKSPVTIIRHIWILDTSENLKIEKKIAFFGNAGYVSFGYNLLENELFIFEHIPTRSPIRKNGIFLISSDWVLTNQGVKSVPFSIEDFKLFYQKAQMQQNQDIGIGIYEIPSGAPYNRMPSISDNVSMYQIKL